MSVTTSDQLCCLLCGRPPHPHLGGVTQTVQAHLLCIKFAKNIKNKKLIVGKTRLQDEVQQCERTNCVFCGNPGAASGCWKPFCPVSFHLPCSLGQEVVNRHDIFMSSCWQHSRRQDRPGGGAGHMCGVCGWTVHPGPSFSTLVSVCCNKIHHRDCIQVLGSLGVQSCPSCQNILTYKTEMIVNGVFFNESLAPSRQKKTEVQYVDISTDEQVTSDQRVSSPGQVPRDIDCSLRDSGISLSSPLEASTPILPENEKTNKRKSITEPDVCNISKRQKSISINGDETEIDCTLLELRPRRLHGDDLRDDSLMEVEEFPGEDDLEGQRQQSKILSIEYQSGEDIGLSTGPDTNGDEHRDKLATFSDILTISDDSLNDSSIEEIDHFDIESLSEDTDFDEEDVAAFHEEMEEAKNQKESEIESKDSGVGSPQDIESPKKHPKPDEDSDKSNPSPNKSKSPVKERLLTKQRKEVLKKIRYLPISERFILHGRNLLPWNQKDENYSEYTSEWMDNYDDCRIDEIIDLNNGEKNFFKLWNSHIRLYSGLGHIFMPTIVLRFIETSGVKILEQNLLRNFFAHLTSLEKMEIIGSDSVLSNMGGGRDRLETPRRRTKLVRRAKCEAKRNFLTDEDKQECMENMDDADTTGNGLVTLPSMPILPDQSTSQRQTQEDPSCNRSGSELKLSPEMPVLKPETKLIDQNKAVSQKSDGDASNIHLEENPETKEKLNDKTFRRLRERKFEDKSSHFAASVRKKKSRKGKEKSEIEFAIKSHKKKKLRLSNKFTPIKRKLRKNFKFYNEQ